MVKIFVIGDPHFRIKHITEGNDLIEKCTSKVKEKRPDYIVLLGDILDTHEVAKLQPMKQACNFIKELSQIAPTYVLMGNHDLSNQTQFLTDEHFFNPLKKWNNVIIVDYPTPLYIKDKLFVFVPYVPPGKFIEALNCLVDKNNDPIDWGVADCIFAHQEFRNVIYGNRKSEKGDVWDESYPMVISGHIHNQCQLGNVYYPGSSLQVASDEDPDKRVWLVHFKNQITIEKINLGLKTIKELVLTYEKIKEFDYELLDKYYIKIKFKSRPEQIRIFRKSVLYADLQKKGARIVFEPIIEQDSLNRDKGEAVVFEKILSDLVSKKSEKIQKAYSLISGI